MSDVPDDHPPFDDGTTYLNGSHPMRYGAGDDTDVEPPPPRQLRTLDDLIGPAIDRAERRAQSIERPVPLPWRMLAEHFGGGLWPGVHYLVSGTGIGKTALALQWWLGAARAGVPSLYIGLELEALQIALRVVGEAAKVPWSALYTGQAGPALIERVRTAAPGLQGLPLHVELARPQGWPSSELPQFVEAMRALYPEPDGPGSRPLFVVLDFLQIIGDEQDANGRSVDLRERIGRASYRCRDVAARLGASVVVVSSTARDKYGQLAHVAESADLRWDTDGNGRPIRRRVLKPDVLVGLGKESGEIEYSADSVSVLARVPNSDDAEGGCDILFVTAKGRATGATWSPLHFTGHGYREAEDGGSFVVARLKEAADQRGARKEEKARAKDDAKAEKILADAVAIARHVLAHPSPPHERSASQRGWRRPAPLDARHREARRSPRRDAGRQAEATDGEPREATRRRPGPGERGRQSWTWTLPPVPPHRPRPRWTAGLPWTLDSLDSPRCPWCPRLRACRERSRARA